MLNHPNIIKIYEYYQDKLFYYIVTELCVGGELVDRIIAEKYLTEQDVKKTMFIKFYLINNFITIGCNLHDINSRSSELYA